MSKFSNKEVFIEKAIRRHGLRFNYKDVVYVDSKTPITISCNKHNNTFTQIPSNHLICLQGCPECISEISGQQKIQYKNKLIKKFTNAEIINIIEDTYGKEVYTFEKLVYTNSKTPFTLVCNKHKTDIKKTLRDFRLKSPYNYCKECKKELFTKEIQDRFLKKHGEIFDYNRCPSILGHDTPIEIKCPTHGWIQTNVGAHLRSDYGCNLCGNEVNFNFKKSDWICIGNKENKKPILYLLKCKKDNECFIKVGITVNDIKVRYKSKRDIPYDWEIITIKEGCAESIWNLEQKIKNNKYKKYEPNLFFTGHTECYSVEAEASILGYLNNSEIK